MLKKKLLCALVFGISFAPSVFAMPRVPADLIAEGEQLRNFSARSNHCGADAPKHLSASNTSSAASKSDNGTSGARSAR